MPKDRIDILFDLAGLNADARALLRPNDSVTYRDVLSLTQDQVHSILQDAASIFQQNRVMELIAYVREVGKDLTEASDLEEVLEELDHVRRAQKSSILSNNRMTLNNNPLPPFSGHLLDWEAWHDKCKAIIGMSVYSICMDSVPTSQEQLAINKEFYYMLYSAFLGGSAFHLVVSIKDNCGYSAWKNIKNFYGSRQNQLFFADQHRKRLEALELDTRQVSASEYVNAHLVGYARLAEYGDRVSDLTKETMFLKGLVDKDYQSVRHNYGRDGKYSFDDLVSGVLRTEQMLLRKDRFDKTGTRQGVGAAKWSGIDYNTGERSPKKRRKNARD